MSRRRSIALGALLVLVCLPFAAVAGPMEDHGFWAAPPGLLPPGAWSWEQCDGWRMVHVPFGQVWGGNWLEAGDYNWHPGAAWWRKVVTVPGFFNYSPWCTWVYQQHVTWGEGGWLVAAGAQVGWDYHGDSGLMREYAWPLPSGHVKVTPFSSLPAGSVVVDHVWGESQEPIVQMADGSVRSHNYLTGVQVLLAGAPGSVPPVPTEGEGVSQATVDAYIRQVVARAETLLEENRQRHQLVDAAIAGGFDPPDVLTQMVLTNTEIGHLRGVAALVHWGRPSETTAQMDARMSTITQHGLQMARAVSKALRERSRIDAPWINTIPPPASPAPFPGYLTPQAPPSEPQLSPQARADLDVVANYVAYGRAQGWNDDFTFSIVGPILANVRQDYPATAIADYFVLSQGVQNYGAVFNALNPVTATIVPVLRMELH